MVKFIAWVLSFALLFIIVKTIVDFGDDAGSTVKQEYQVSSLLKKYQDFKDLSAAIDKKRADIEVYRNELIDLKKDGIQDKDSRFYYEQRKAELTGIISIYNDLCSRYNSNMSKFNYRFTNVGDLPQSNLEPLPREYKPYILSLH